MRLQTLHPLRCRRLSGFALIVAAVVAPERDGTVGPPCQRPDRFGRYIGRH